MEKLSQEEIDERIANETLIREYQGNLPCFDHVEPKIYNSKNLEVYIYGKPKDWRDDFVNHTQLISELRSKGINKVFVPNISKFTGEVCEDFNFDILGNVKGITVYNHKSVDGMVVPNNSSALFCTADCPVVIYNDYLNDILIVAHAGLCSVVDKTRVFTGVPSRPNESVVDEMLNYMEDSDQYEILIFCGIGPESFRYEISDQQFGVNNEILLRYLLNKYGSEAVPLGLNHCGISIPNIIRQQFINHGFSPGKIFFDEINTYEDSRFWSHKRAVELHQHDGRNGILIIHK